MSPAGRHVLVLVVAAAVLVVAPAAAEEGAVAPRPGAEGSAARPGAEGWAARPGAADERPLPALELPASITAISDGDLAWWRGDRATAVAAWRRALAIATGVEGVAVEGVGAEARVGVDQPARARPDSPPAGRRPDIPFGPTPTDRAAEAMARVRLLQLGGTAAPFVHEAKLDRALADCPFTEPWCAVAAADWDLFMPPFTGADPTRVAGTLAGSPLAGPSAARIAVATGTAAPLDALADPALDGMGLGIRATGRLRPPAPGTWVLGVGVGGAPGAGVGLTVRFAHPDLAWRAHRLEVLAGADTRGGAFASASLRTATRPALLFGASGSRFVGDVWADGAATPYSLATTRLSAAAAPRWGAVQLTAGASTRADWLGGALAADTGASSPSGTGAPALVAGPLVALTLGDLAADGLRLTADTSFGAYTHAALGADWRAHPPLLGGTLALRAALTHVPTDSPFYRLPTAGGADLLRGLPAGRFRAPTLAAAQAEYRHVLVGPLHGALFVDGAYIDGAHVTAGAGLRLVLPPGRDNVTRLDIGFGPEGWGLAAAWGDAF